MFALAVPVIVSAQDENAGPLAQAAVALPSGRVGQYYEAMLFRGGLPPYRLDAAPGQLPDGLAIDARGYLSGTPTGEGVYRFSFRALDASTPPNQISGEAVIRVFQ